MLDLASAIEDDAVRERMIYTLHLVQQRIYHKFIVDRAMAPDSSPSVRKGVGRAYLEHIVGNYHLDHSRYSAEKAKGDNRVFSFMRQSNFGRFKLFTLAKDFDETTRYEVLTILDFYVKDLGFGVDNRRQ